MPLLPDLYYRIQAKDTMDGFFRRFWEKCPCHLYPLRAAGGRFVHHSCRCRSEYVRMDQHGLFPAVCSRRLWLPAVRPDLYAGVLVGGEVAGFPENLHTRVGTGRDEYIKELHCTPNCPAWALLA